MRIEINDKNPGELIIIGEHDISSNKFKKEDLLKFLTSLQKQIRPLIRVDTPDEEIKRQADIDNLFGGEKEGPMSYLHRFDYIFDNLTSSIKGDRF